MAEQSKKITVYIFLFVVFILLAFYLMVWIYNNYMTTKTYSEKTTETALECNLFSFAISKIRYEDVALSFEIESRVTEEKNAPRNMVIKVDGVEYPLQIGEYIDFRHQVSPQDRVIADKFTIYPEGCERYNSKECSVATKKCIQADR